MLFSFLVTECVQDNSELLSTNFDEILWRGRPTFTSAVWLCQETVRFLVVIRITVRFHEFFHGIFTLTG